MIFSRFSSSAWVPPDFYRSLWFASKVDMLTNLHLDHRSYHCYCRPVSELNNLSEHICFNFNFNSLMHVGLFVRNIDHQHFEGLIRNDLHHPRYSNCEFCVVLRRGCIPHTKVRRHCLSHFLATASMAVCESVSVPVRYVCHFCVRRPFVRYHRDFSVVSF